MARLVAPVNSRACSLTSTRLPGDEHGPLDVGLVQQGQQGPRGEDGAVGQLTDPPGERREVDQHGDERGRAPPVRRGRPRPFGHLGQGVTASLPRGPRQVGEGGVGARARCAQALFGLGPVGLEQFCLQAGQLVGDGRPREGVHGHSPEPQPIEALLQVDVPGGQALLVGRLGPVGVGELVPVGDRLHVVVEGQRGGLVTEDLFVSGQGLLGARVADGGEGVDVGGVDGPTRPGPGEGGQVGEDPAPPDEGPGLGPRDPAPMAQPGSGRLCPVGGPVPRGVKRGGGLGHDGVDAGPLGHEGLDRLGVGRDQRAGVGQAVDHLGQGLDIDIHDPIFPSGCNRSTETWAAHPTGYPTRRWRETRRETAPCVNPSLSDPVARIHSS